MNNITKPTAEDIRNTFRDVYLALLSNPHVVTIVSKSKVVTQQGDYVPHIQPWLYELANKLTLAYCAFDQETIADDILKQIDELQKHISDVDAYAKSIRNGSEK